MRAFTVTRPLGQAWVSFPGNRPIRSDIVFYADSDNITAEEVKKSLIVHDGYPSDIIVRQDP